MPTTNTQRATSIDQNSGNLALVGPDFEINRILPRVVSLTDHKFAPTTRASLPVWTNEVFDKLGILAKLETGWDGYDGKQIRGEVINFVILVLGMVMTDKSPIPEIVPLSDGGVQLEWHEGNRDVELAIDAPYQCELWYRNPITEETGGAQISRGDFAPLVQQLNSI